MCNCEHPIRITVTRPSTGEAEQLLVGCGRCPLCMRKKRYEWAFRIGAEIQKCTDAYFCTLTFDRHNLPKPDDNGRYYWQCFMKRLRKNNPDIQGFKYFACSELGSTTERLHFHVIFINTGKRRWELERAIRGSWHGGIVVDVQNIKNARRCAEYVSKYCYQQIDAPSTLYVTHHPSGTKFCYRLPKYFRRYVSKGMGLALLSDLYLAYLRDRGDGTYHDEFGGVLPLPSYFISHVWPKTSEEYELIKGCRLEDALDAQAVYEREQSEVYGDNPHPKKTKCQRDAARIRKELRTRDKYGKTPFLHGYPPELVGYIEEQISKNTAFEIYTDPRFFDDDTIRRFKKASEDRAYLRKKNVHKLMRYAGSIACPGASCKLFDYIYKVIPPF